MLQQHEDIIICNFTIFELKGDVYGEKISQSIHTD